VWRQTLFLHAPRSGAPRPDNGGNGVDKVDGKQLGDLRLKADVVKGVEGGRQQDGGRGAKGAFKLRCAGNCKCLAVNNLAAFQA
jgi:hypothetical protein